MPSFPTIAGESGSGKTTLAVLLLGFIPPTDRRDPLSRQGPRGRCRAASGWQFRREVQAIFQDPFAVFNPFYKVDHLLTVPIEQASSWRRSKAEARSKMEEALRAVGLRPEETLGRFPHQLSGGQRQRINVARALLLQPRLLIADEPVSMVDASLRATILETLRNLQTRLRHLDHLHHPRPDHRLPDLDNIIVLYRGGVGGGRRGPGDQGPAAPVYAPVDLLDPDARRR